MANAVASSSTTTTGQRRVRPNLYTPQACERCRSRKQRCLIDDEDAETCRNCADGDFTCVFTARSEKPAKRSRIHPIRPAPAPDEMPNDHSSNGTIPSPSNRATPTIPTSSLRQLAMSTPVVALMLVSRQSLLQPDLGVQDDMALQSDSAVADPIHEEQSWGDWDTGLDIGTQGGDAANGPTPSIDWQAWLATASQARPDQTAASNLPTMQHDEALPPLSNTMPQYSIGNPNPAISPGIASSDGSVFETAKGLAMISLEAAAEPHYVGESSGSLWTTIISKGMKVPLTSPEARPNQPPRDSSPSPMQLALLRAHLQRAIPNHVADAILETVYRHLHSRYPFMDWLAFDAHWQARDGILLAVAQDRRLNKEASTAAFFLLMVFAIGMQLGKPNQSHGLLRAEDYYTLALPYLNTIVQLHNLANVQGLLLLAMYSLRDSRGPSVWYLSGVTIRLCIGLGLHREPSKRALQPIGNYTAEMRKRVFWSCYTIDRMMAMILGRPPGISDDDIDVCLPDPMPIRLEVSVSSLQVSSVGSAIHFIKLQRLESQIQRLVYTVAHRRRDGDSSVSRPLLQSIDQWEAEVPGDGQAVPCCSKDWFHLRGVEARLHLLRPLCTKEDQMTSFLPLLAQNAARGCELQKRTLQAGITHSSTLIHSTFICGLALLYSVFVKPDVLPLREVFSAIKAVSNTLFAYSQRQTSTGALYDVFEELSASCLDRVSQNPQDRVGQPGESVTQAWQTASAEATVNLAANDYVDFLRTLDIPFGEVSGATTDTLWDLAAFTPGNLAQGADTLGGGFHI